MTENQWLLFIGLPAFVAIILLIADYVRARRRRIEMTVAPTLLDEMSERDPAEDPDRSRIGSQVGTANPLAELEKLIRAKPPS